MKTSLSNRRSFAAYCGALIALLAVPALVLVVLESQAPRAIASGVSSAGAAVYAGSFASLPACTTTKYVYSVLSSPLVGTCDGASNLSWRAMGFAMPSRLDLSSLTNFTNDSTPTAFTMVNGVLVGSTVNDPATNLRLAGVTPPSAPYSVTVFSSGFATTASGNVYAGVYLRNSLNGRVEPTYLISGAGTGFLQNTRWNSPSSFGGSINSWGAPNITTPFGIRVSVAAGGAITSAVSSNGGLVWTNTTSSTVAAFLGAVDDVGLVYANIGTGQTTSVPFFSLTVQ